MTINKDLSHDLARRFVTGAVLTAMLLAALGVTAAAAAPARGGCPAGDGNTWALSDLGTWTNKSLDGFVAEFGSLKEAVVALIGPKAKAKDLVSLVEETFGLIDANGDGWICMSSTNPEGLPDYLFQVADNKYHVRA